jgi:hypothetical protein
LFHRVNGGANPVIHAAWDFNPRADMHQRSSIGCAADGGGARKVRRGSSSGPPIRALPPAGNGGRSCDLPPPARAEDGRPGGPALETAQASQGRGMRVRPPCDLLDDAHPLCGRVASLAEWSDLVRSGGLRYVRFHLTDEATPSNAPDPFSHA